MNLHGIDLNLLVAFDAINAERNVTRAGARIGRTQPAMSAALARLRDLLKDELFVRGPSGLQPTPRAAELAEPIATALRDIQRTLDFTQDFDPSAVRMTFSLGLSGHAGSIVLPRLLAVLSAKAPGIDLKVLEYGSRDAAIDLLDAGDVDLTVGIPLSASSRILNARLFQERFVCILRKNHPAAERALDTQTFLSLNHIQIAPDTDGLDFADTALAAKGMRRRVALSVPQMVSALQLVAASDMIAIVMEGVVANSGFADRLTMVDFPLPLNPVPFVVSWHRRNDAHPTQRWILNTLLGAFPHVWLASENLCGDLVQPCY